MLNPVLALLVASVTASPLPVNLQAQSANIIEAYKNNPNVILIAQKYEGDDPHGPDPHGDDPHDEYHDVGLPAYKEQKANKAPSDVYGNEYPNTKAPY